jgi:hypothetical protein
MPRKTLGTIASGCLALAVVLGAAGATGAARADDVKTQYPNMAPVEQYRMERDAEIALARTAAPESISKDAEVLVLGQKGYEAAAKGTNGFVCMVARSWAAGIDDPDFWNPKLRAPICFNASAVRSSLAINRKKTELILAGRSRTQMFEDIKTALDKKELARPDNGAMCYMMSKQQYLSDKDKQWLPHLMFFMSRTEPTAWGANAAGSPILGGEDTMTHMTVFLVPVANWSDGTAGPAADTAHSH